MFCVVIIVMYLSHGQLNLAHIAINKKHTKETNTKKRQCPLSSVQVKIREVSPDGNSKLWRKGVVK